MLTKTDFCGCCGQVVGFSRYTPAQLLKQDELARRGAKAAQLHAAGMPVADIAERYSVSRSTVRRWLRAARAMPAAAEAPAASGEQNRLNVRDHLKMEAQIAALAPSEPEDAPDTHYNLGWSAGWNAHERATTEQAVAQWQMRETAEDEHAISVLATFAHEVLMGAIEPSELADKARLALMRSTYIDFERVVALTPQPTAPVRQPLTDAQIDEGKRSLDLELDAWLEPWVFGEHGVRFAETHHGIIAAKDEPS